MGFKPRSSGEVAPRSSFVRHLLQSLSPLGELSTRPMFGGHGVFCDGRLIAIASLGALYVKADAAARDEYERAGIKPFRPSTVQIRMSYYQVPDDAVSDPDQLREWGRRAIEAAARAEAAAR